MMCGEPATTIGWMNPGLLHTAFITDLTPSTRYYYVYGDDAYGWSAEQQFTAPPAPGSDAQFQMIAYGDMGKGVRPLACALRLCAL
jgi:hypothetical protein